MGPRSRSAADHTPITPGMDSAFRASTPRSSIPCGTGDRTTRRWAWPGSEMSAANLPVPSSSGRSSTRRNGLPINWRITRAAAHTALVMFW